MGDPIERGGSPASRPASLPPPAPGTAPGGNTHSNAGASPAASGPAPAGTGIANIRVAPAPAGPARPQPPTRTVVLTAAYFAFTENLRGTLSQTVPIRSANLSEAARMELRYLLFETPLEAALATFERSGSLREARARFLSCRAMCWPDVPPPDISPRSCNAAAMLVNATLEKSGKSDERFSRIYENEDARLLIRDMTYYFVRTRRILKIDTVIEFTRNLYEIIFSLNLAELDEKTAPTSAPTRKTGEK